MRKSRNNNHFMTVNVEGAILPADLLQRIMEGDKSLGGLTPADYHLLSGEKLNEETNKSWNRMLGAWASFKTECAKLPDTDLKTTPTRERWLLPLFNELGYGRLNISRAIERDGKSFAVSHFWGNTPIHLVGSGVDLNTRTIGVAGAARISPHGLVQELLNCSDEYLWGFVSNGYKLRILRDNSSLTRQAFVEFDLEAMMEGEVYSDFVLLWLLCHESRVEAERPEECWLEKWSKTAQSQGTRALDQLRDGVTDAISKLGSGFISHPSNQNLREKLRSGELDKQDYYRGILRLVYRLLFIFVAEDRDLLFLPGTDVKIRERYTRYYSTLRLRRMAGHTRGTKHPDLYNGFKIVMQKLGTDTGCPELGLPALGGFLFSEDAEVDFKTCEISNEDFLSAIRKLAYTIDGNNVRRNVDFKNLGSEELGSVYESLLELHPELNLDAGIFELKTAAGNERKTTGSYYTPSCLIQCLLDTALDSVLDKAVKSADPEKAILSLKICDPACGSGHFLIAAAHRIAKQLAIVRTGDIEPSPDAVRKALRQVIARCIYGVDQNLMAVEICKVALWMESLDPGKPLSFLDHHIQCGNSLIGATTKLLKEGIPDAAFNSADGDDPKICSDYKKQNKKEHDGQGSLFAYDLQPWEQLGNLTEAMIDIDSEEDDSIAAEHYKQNQYEKLVKSLPYDNGWLLADAWCAAFMWKKTRDFDYPISEEVFRKIKRNPYSCPGWMKAEIKRLAKQYRFFHWHLAFPDVFYSNKTNASNGLRSGFDCVLGNPPWERVKLQEKEFFASRDERIANAANKATRERMIEQLPKENPNLAEEYHEAKRSAENISNFVRTSGRYPLAGVGDVNTYAIFAELFRSLLSKDGRAGILCPSGIATDNTTRAFFDSLTTTQSLAGLFDFENRSKLFPAVDSRMKFCALTISGSPCPAGDYAFFLTDPAQLEEGIRRFRLSASDIALLNPNTHTSPIFRTKQDAELTKAIYKQVPILINEACNENPWNINFGTMFHMANDSYLFRTEPDDGLVPLYESKMIHVYDHRFGTYENVINLKDTHLPTPSLEQHQDPSFRIKPRYWVSKAEVEARLKDWPHKWLLAFRDVTNGTNERTAIFSFLSRIGAGNKAPLLFSNARSDLFALLLGNLNSLCFDFIARQKIGGMSLSYFILKQLPVLRPESYKNISLIFVATRVIELVYTAWDIKAFADDMWKEADETLRNVIQKQWNENRAATGGHEWTPPEWTEIDEDGIPLPPFKWDEDRRAVLKAELDAFYAKLYGLNRKQLRYILDPHGLSKEELKDILDPWEDPTCSGPHALPDKPALDFPSETYRTLKENEEKQYGEYRTRRLVLEAWERLQAQGLTSEAND